MALLRFARIYWLVDFFSSCWVLLGIEERISNNNKINMHNTTTVCLNLGILKGLIMGVQSPTWNVIGSLALKRCIRQKSTIGVLLLLFWFRVTIRFSNHVHLKWNTSLWEASPLQSLYEELCSYKGLLYFGDSVCTILKGNNDQGKLYRVQASTTDHLRDYAPNLEKYEAVQIFPMLQKKKLGGLQFFS